MTISVDIGLIPSVIVTDPVSTLFPVGGAVLFSVIVPVGISFSAGEIVSAFIVLLGCLLPFTSVVIFAVSIPESAVIIVAIIVSVDAVFFLVSSISVAVSVGFAVLVGGTVPGVNVTNGADVTVSIGFPVECQIYIFFLEKKLMRNNTTILLA